MSDRTAKAKAKKHGLVATREKAGCYLWRNMGLALLCVGSGPTWEEAFEKAGKP